MRKILIIAVLIIIVIAAAVYWFISKPESVVEPEENYLSIIETETVSFGEGHTYSIDSAEFIIYPPDLDNFNFGYFEAYNNGELVYESVPQYAVLDFLAFETSDGKYFVLSDYSGGAHCCFKEYIFFLNDEELKPIKELYTGNASIREEDLVLKDNNIYLQVFDDRFAYFYTPYANSYFFFQHLKVDGDEIEIANSSFVLDHLQEVEKCENEIEEILPDSSLDFESYAPKLVCIAVNYIIASQEDKAWNKVQDYFTKIPLEFYGLSVDFETFKNEFLDLYQLESFSEN